MKPEIDNLNGVDVKLNRYACHLKETSQSAEIQAGLYAVSKVGKAAEQVLYDELGEGSNLALPPIDTSIGEYTRNDFTVINPLTNETFSLIQSPQIMKEAAAIAYGSNWRRTFCYRPEPGDATHAQVFQQIDVELRNGDGYKARRLAEKILQITYQSTKSRDLPNIPEFDYLSIVFLYGNDQPNLHNGLFLDISHDIPVLRIRSQQARENLSYIVGNRLVSPQTLSMQEGLLHGTFLPEEYVVIGQIQELRAIRKQAIDNDINESSQEQEISGYWLINMPYARRDSMNNLVPTHHLMSMPFAAIKNPAFSFQGLSDEELVCLECDSYDLVACTSREAVEIAGGDRRIHTATLQIDALRRMGKLSDEYHFLLQALKFNEENHNYALAGFAFGLERLTMLLFGIDAINKVQFFPMNSPNGEWIHARGKNI